MTAKHFFAVILILIFIPALTCPIFADADKESVYVDTLYNESSGLPTGEANEVIQTDDGYIWIGSYGGLIRYDGTSFRNFSQEGALPSSIRTLCQDPSGSLWIGTNDSGVYVMRSGVFSQIEGPADNSFLCIRDFTIDKSGTVYVASNSGMAAITDDKLIPLSGEHAVGGTVYSVDVDSRGRVWGSLNAGTCVVTDGNKELAFYSSEEFFNYSENPIEGAIVTPDIDVIPIYCTGSDTDGNIWLGTDTNVLAKLSFSSDSLDPDDFGIEYVITEGVYTHNAIKKASNGKIVVCGNIGACVISPDGSVTAYSEQDHAASLNSGCIDYEGNVWLASTAYGVVKYSKGYFSSPNRAAGLEGVPINAVAKQGERFFAATDSGLLEFDSDWNRIDDDFTGLFDGVRVRCLLTDSSGNIWAAAYSASCPTACLSPDGEIKIYGMSDGLLSTNARTLYELSDGGIAVGTQEGLCIIRAGEIKESYGSQEGIAITSVLSIAEDSDGGVLVGSDGGGIYKIQNGTVTNYGFSEGLPDGVILRMIPDGDSGFFISAGSSLYYWDKDGFQELEIEKGAGSIFDFVLRDGALWIMQNNGILKYDRADILAGKNAAPVEYGMEQGLSGSLNANTWNIIDPEDGRLYLSTRNGVSVFGFEEMSSILPKGIFNSINVDGEESVYSDGILLKQDANRITLEFSVLSYTGTSSVGISYMLEGFDREITEVIGEKTLTVSYTNLPGGEYTFRLKVFDPENPQSFAEYTVDIVKQKKLYEQIGFIAAAIILGLLMTVGIILIALKVNINHLRKRQREYKSIVEQSLKTFARSIDAKDRYTNGHSIRVAEYSRELSRRLGFDAEEQERVYYIALLHDIGKIGIPDSVLNKPGKLTPEEMEIIKTHPKIGGEILKKFTAIEGIADGAKYHHERIDGKGYNSGLSGEDIPLIARIIGVADTYDAMSSDRPYRKALSSQVIESELKRVSGTQLDPKIVPHMLDMIDDGTAPLAPDKHRESSDIGAHYHM